ncbi:MAG TPA: 3'(2'),5'-bisphosphate nucleotidase CysQ [Microbacterium sp.]|nr:3'(2'),5'-bisphosphate nucleotidase CysQ [Microbacterium sp.]
MADDTAIAGALARGAGELLLRVRADAGPDRLGSAGLKDEGDRRAQEFLARELSARFPGDAVLSEEAADGDGRLTADRVWIIDPLDGTREFSEGRHDWAVHVALWERGDLTAGAVALPGIGTVLSTADPTTPWAAPTRIRLAVSRTRPTALVQRLADALDAQLVPMGSAGYKVGAVIRGEADAYVHSGGQYQWDSAAPVAVARHAGLFTSRVDGSPLVYNGPDPYLPDLVVCNPHVSQEVLRRLASLLEEDRS